MREGIKCIHYIIRHFKIDTIYQILLSLQYQGCYDELRHLACMEKWKCMLNCCDWKSATWKTK
jgi:hypothetical protein